MQNAEASEAGSGFSRCTIDATFLMAELRPLDSSNSLSSEISPFFQFFQFKVTELGSSRGNSRAWAD